MPNPSPEAFAFLANRRSHPAKMFSGPVPDRAQLLDILTAATRVPDHGKLEPWRLVVLEKSSLPRLADLAETRAKALGGDAEKIAKGRGQYEWGQVMVVVISSPKSTEKVPMEEQILSAGALCIGIVNAAEASGWGANWLTGWPAHDRGFITEAFNATAEETVAGIIHIGTPPRHEAPDRPRPDLQRLITWAE